MRWAASDPDSPSSSDFAAHLVPLQIPGNPGPTLAVAADNNLQRTRRDNRALKLLAIAAGSVALCLALALRYPLAPSLANPRAAWSSLVEPTSLNAAVHLAIYLGLTLLYVQALRLLTALRTPAPRGVVRVIVGAWLLVSAVLLAVAPAGESHDIFDYIFRGRMMAEQGANPLAETPLEHRRQPYFRYVAWHSHVDTYGPLWELASAGVATGVRSALQALGLWHAAAPACPDSPQSCWMLMTYLTGYRLLAVGLTGLSALLIYGIVRRDRPLLAAAALAAWLWNPLLLVSTAVGAHNDALMMVLLLAVLWLMQRRRWLAALLVFVVAAHVKLTALILAPALGLWIVRRCGWRRAVVLGAAALAGGLLLSWLLYAPFGGWATLPRMLAERAIFLANSPWHVLYYVLYTRLGWPYATVWHLTVQAPTWLFGASSLLLSLWLLDFRPPRWKQSPPPDWARTGDAVLWRTVAAVSLLYLAVGAFWFQHWYVVWVLAPAALLPASRLTRYVLPWLSAGALAANLVPGLLLAGLPKGASRTGIYVLAVALIWVPAVAAAWAARQRRA